MKKPDNLIGQSFNNLTVLRFSRSSPQGVYWICRCELCGQETECRGDALKSGRVKSCGCYRQKRMREIGESGIGPKSRWGDADAV